MNQTTNIGKIPKDSNPPKFLCKSFESKEPLVSIIPHYFTSFGMELCTAGTRIQRKGLGGS